METAFVTEQVLNNYLMNQIINLCNKEKMLELQKKKKKKET